MESKHLIPGMLAIILMLFFASLGRRAISDRLERIEKKLDAIHQTENPEHEKQKGGE